MYSRAYTVDYFIEGHRFNILEDIGCYPAAYLTPLAFVLLFCWPLAIGSGGLLCMVVRSISFDSFLLLNSNEYFIFQVLIIRACTKRYTDIRASVMSLAA